MSFLFVVSLCSKVSLFFYSAGTFLITLQSRIRMPSVTASSTPPASNTRLNIQAYRLPDILSYNIPGLVIVRIFESIHCKRSRLLIHLNPELSLLDLCSSLDLIMG